MRKKVAAAVCVMFLGGLAACAGKENKDNKDYIVIQQESKTDTTEQETETIATVQETEADITTLASGITETELTELIDKNNYVNLYIYGSGNLPLVEEEIDYDKERYYQVREDVFEDYAAFEEYIRSIYCKETADLLLYDYPMEGTPKYVDIDGKLYLDIYCAGGKGYYVDWSEYTVEITASDEESCEFTVTASVEWPAENPVKEPYTVEGAAVKENNVWLLKKIIS